jgi:Protein of unknown function (DUF2934)
VIPMPADDIDTAIAESHLTLDARIRRRAYEVYLRRAGRAGSDLEDWLEAEREVLGESAHDSAENRATVIGHAGRPGIVL